MSDLKFAFFGATKYSKELLLFLIDNKIIPSVIFSIPKLFNISYSDKKVENSNYASLENISIANKIPYYEVDSIKGKRTKDYYKTIEQLNLDLLLVLGWYYMVPEKIRSLARLGAWGIHASLLPEYAGGAPLNWAIINGEKKTGVTLFRMEDGIDDGDIIMQRAFSISIDDTIKNVYEKATLESKKFLVKTLIKGSKIKFKKQDKTKIKVYSQRSPEDGEIDLKKNAIDIHNFIRAQSDPYPGAFIKTVDGKKIIIEKAKIG
jgi:methionyl-tRNA formyltransferase